MIQFQILRTILTQIDSQTDEEIYIDENHPLGYLMYHQILRINIKENIRESGRRIDMSIELTEKSELHTID